MWQAVRLAASTTRARSTLLGSVWGPAGAMFSLLILQSIFAAASSATWSNFSISKPISEPLVVVVAAAIAIAWVRDPLTWPHGQGQDQGQAGKS